MPASAWCDGDDLIKLFEAALHERIKEARRFRENERFQLSDQMESREESPDAQIALEWFLAKVSEEAEIAGVKDANTLLRAAIWGAKTKDIAKNSGVSVQTVHRRKKALERYIQHNLQDIDRGIPPRINFSAALLPPVRYGRRGENFMSSHRGHLLQLRLEQRSGVVWAHAYCEPARHIAVLAFSAEQMRVAGTFVQGADEPPVEHQVKLPPDTDRVIAVAVSSLWFPEVYRDRHDRDAIFWILAADTIYHAIQAGDTVEMIEARMEGRWELAEAAAHRVRPDMIRRGEKIPKPFPELRQPLKEAQKHGRAQQFAQAATVYREAWNKAQKREDIGGSVRAGMGLFIALNYLGFLEAAERVLIQLLRSVPLDARWASWVAREMADHYLNYGNTEDARRWLSQTSAVDYPPDAPQYHQRYARLLLAEDRLDEALNYIEAHLEALQGLRSGQQRLLQAERFLTERRVFTADDDPWRIQDDYTELRRLFEQVSPAHRGARWLLTMATAGPLMGHSGLHVRLLEGAHNQLRPHDGNLLGAWEQRDLILTAERLGEPEAGRKLLRLAFLHTAVACGDRPLLAVARGAERLLWLSPQALWLEERPLDGVTLIQQLIQAASQELRRDQCGEACARLGALLFPEPLSGEVLVASDGLLTEAPLYAAHYAAHRGVPLPAFREIIGPRRSLDVTPKPGPITSLADPHGDLPGAAAEVSPCMAQTHLRGAGATRQALSAVHGGLLVLGVHTRSSTDGRYLDLADGPVYPEQLAAMDLGGAVVYLSGCTTAAQATLRGVELSFASALLQANASAVATYRWSVRDEVAKQAAEVLLSTWPHPNPAVWVRDGIQSLIKAGIPEHVWGALNLY
ncbi:MAG: CHAT domain-containing protein [Myxococcota bacterium]